MLEGWVNSRCRTQRCSITLLHTELRVITWRCLKLKRKPSLVRWAMTCSNLGHNQRCMTIHRYIIVGYGRVRSKKNYKKSLWICHVSNISIVILVVEETHFFSNKHLINLKYESLTVFSPTELSIGPLLLFCLGQGRQAAQITSYQSFNDVGLWILETIYYVPPPCSLTSLPVLGQWKRVVPRVHQ